MRRRTSPRTPAPRSFESLSTRPPETKEALRGTKGREFIARSITERRCFTERDTETELSLVLLLRMRRTELYLRASNSAVETTSALHYSHTSIFYHVIALPPIPTRSRGRGRSRDEREADHWSGQAPIAPAVLSAQKQERLVR